jgi:AcrR family transcriptional regulator
MSLYNHVPNKSALLDGMVEVLLGELRIPPEDEGWEERIRGAYRAFRPARHEHPNVFPLFVTRPPDTMDGVWLVEEFLKTLVGAGSTPRRRCTLFARSPATPRGTPWQRCGASPWTIRAPVGRESPPRGTVPPHRRVEPRTREVDRDAEFEFGLDLILQGLRERL